MNASAERGEARAKLLCIVILISGCARESNKPPPPPPKQAPVEAPAVKPAPPPDRTKSLVMVTCGTSFGPGFFSAPDRVVVRARFTCDQPRVNLHDGRTLLAKVKVKVKELDVAELELAGGEGEPVPFASGLDVKETDDVSVPGCCGGTVRSAVRTRLGVPHFEVAFDRVPAPGGVVLDSRGRAIGLVTDASLVLPIDAVGPSPAWAKLVERARPAALEEVQALRRALEKPALVTALVDEGGTLNAILLSRTTPGEVELEGCTVTPNWEKFRMTAWFDDAGRELFAFIDKHDLDPGLFMSTVTVPCNAGAELKLKGADPLLERVRIGKTAQAMTPTGLQAPDAGALAAAKPQEQPGPAAADERVWRGRYRALHDERERFEADLRAKQRFIDDADAAARRNPHRVVGLPLMTPEERVQYDQYKKDLETAEEQRSVFRRREDDLEREASNQSVPREWRR